jgi:hypothetical protein
VAEIVRSASGTFRFEVPDGLTPSEKRAVDMALERYLRRRSRQPGPWALGGRAQGLALGALQLRFQSTEPWTEIRLNPYTRRGADPRIGRGDTR